jgi:hypothetical protein
VTGSGDAIQREADWLNTVDGILPSLPSSAGGPWEVIGAYVQGAQTRTQATAIYVMRGAVQQVRVANQRIRPRYPMRLELRWPVRVTSPGSSSIAATEQQAFDDAIELLRQRITGPLGDKSHGGRFLAAAEAVRGQVAVDVRFEKAAQTIKADKELRASVSYFIDDFEINA